MESLAIVLFVLIIAMATAIGTTIISLIFLTVLFRKIGIAGWKAWVPLYNIWTLLELAKLPGWVAFLALAPAIVDTLPDSNPVFLPLAVAAILAAITSWVYLIVACYRIGIRMGKPGMFALLAIFVSPIWLAILAFGKATWPKEPLPSTAGAPQPPTSATPYPMPPVPLPATSTPPAQQAPYAPPASSQPQNAPQWQAPQLTNPPVDQHPRV